MTAPALIALAHGSSDPRTVDTIHALTEVVACMRPDLRIETAFFEGDGSSFDATVRRLAAEGHEEIVIVPLLLVESFDASIAISRAVEIAQDRHEVRIEVTKPLGIESAFFSVLDRRLRSALRENRVRELDALVLAGAGSSDPLANALVARAARAWGSRHKLPTIAAFAAAAPPAASEAVRAHRTDGRRHIAVGMLFLTPGSAPDRVRELALEAGAVAVAEPIGAADEVAEAILARYAFGAVGLVSFESLFAEA